MQRQSSSNAGSTQRAPPHGDLHSGNGSRPGEKTKLVETHGKHKNAQRQDVAFERDYVLVEKRAVEVNAFADQLATEHGGMARTPQDGQRGTMVRRATTQGSPAGVTGAQVAPSRALQIVSGKRPDHLHHRQSSYERRIKDSSSATSAISKAINMASGRLLNMGFSPPLGFGRSGQSPPSYNPFPALSDESRKHVVDRGWHQGLVAIGRRLEGHLDRRRVGDTERCCLWLCRGQI